MKGTGFLAGRSPFFSCIDLSCPSEDLNQGVLLPQLACCFRDLFKSESICRQSMPVIGDIISPQEMVESFTRVTGKKAIYNSAYTREDFLHHFLEFSLNELLVQEVLGMVTYAVEYGYFSKDRDLQWNRQKNPDTLKLEQFLRSTDCQDEKIVF